MRIFTRRGERVTVPEGLREEPYSSVFGVGSVATAGDLPFRVVLPSARLRPLKRNAPPSRWAALLERYFAGEAVEFDLDLERYAELAGLTPFERDVYAALGGVPRGSVISYGELAAVAGHPGAARAVGSVMARNELPVILPCHRVVRSDGSLGLYGDDPQWKHRLLVLEGFDRGWGRSA